MAVSQYNFIYGIEIWFSCNFHVSQNSILLKKVFSIILKCKFILACRVYENRQQTRFGPQITDAPISNLWELQFIIVLKASG